MFSIPQTILKQLLTTFNTSPERLTDSEAAIAKRIAYCSGCDRLWIKRKHSTPERCPGCHSRAWNRPFLSALIAADTATTPRPPSQAPDPGQEEGA